MIEVLSEGTRKARKEHQCFDCYRPIVKGQVYAFQTCKYDDVYTICQHQDCRAASEFYRKSSGLSFWDFDDGIPPLMDIISDGGEYEADYNYLRGYFPHVVCRLEWHEQKADRRLAQ